MKINRALVFLDSGVRDCRRLRGPRDGTSLYPSGPGCELR